jgi:hypothetical protein
MLSSPRIASASGDALTSPLQIKPNQNNIQWQWKTLHYKFFESLWKLIQLTIFHTCTHLLCQQRVEIKGQNYSTTDDAQASRNNLELTNGHAQYASKIAWIVWK